MIQQSSQLLKVILAVLVLLLSGCAGTVSNMRAAPVSSAVVAPEKDKAIVIFARLSGMGFAI
jgi:uncharacterized protein YceK